VVVSFEFVLNDDVAQGKFLPFDLNAALAECSSKLTVTIAEAPAVEKPVAPAHTPTASSASSQQTTEVSSSQAAPAAPARVCGRFRTGSCNVRWADLDCEGKRRRVFRLAKAAVLGLLGIWALCALFGGCNGGKLKKFGILQENQQGLWNEIGALKAANEQLKVSALCERR
jgi:hypothetical protein